MIIEGNGAIRGVDVVSIETVTGNNPFRVEALQRRMPQKHACQNMTGTMSKENAIRQRPPTHRVLLDTGFQHVLRGKITRA